MSEKSGTSGAIEITCHVNFLLNEYDDDDDATIVCITSQSLPYT